MPHKLFVVSMYFFRFISLLCAFSISEIRWRASLVLLNEPQYYSRCCMYQYNTKTIQFTDIEISWANFSHSISRKNTKRIEINDRKSEQEHFEHCEWKKNIRRTFSVLTLYPEKKSEQRKKIKKWKHFFSKRRRTYWERMYISSPACPLCM